MLAAEKSRSGPVVKEISGAGCSPKLNVGLPAGANRLGDIEPAQSPTPRLKNTFQWLRECLSLGVKWGKIAINHILPGRVFSLAEQRYDNPFKATDFDQKISSAITKTLNLSLDYLQAIQEKHSSEAIAKAQKNVIDEICHGPGSDFLFDAINFLIQEISGGRGQVSLLDQLPRHQRQQMQQLLVSLQSSGVYSRVKELSLYFTRDQQRQLLQKVNEFPLKQFSVGRYFVQRVFNKLQQVPQLNALISQVIKGQGKEAKFSLDEKIASISSQDLVPELKNMLEISAEILDSYKRASQQPNPVKAAEIRNSAIQKLHRQVSENTYYVPSFHTLMDSISEAQQKLNESKLLTVNPLVETRLFELAKVFCPQISDELLFLGLTKICKQTAAPIQIFKTLTDRLNLQQEKTALFNLLHGHSEIAQGMMNIFLNGIKALVTGQTADTVQTEPKPLADELDFKGAGRFVQDLLAGSTSPLDLRQVMLDAKHLPLMRNLLSQSNFEDALESCSNKLPVAFRQNLQQVLTEYHLDTLSRVGKSIMPHVSDAELRLILERLPIEVFNIVSEKVDRVLNYLGDPDNNLLTALDHQRAADSTALHSLWNQCFLQSPGMLSADNTCFLNFLNQSAIHHDKQGKIPAHRLVTLQHKRDQVRAQLDINGEISTLKGFDQLGKLLAEMGIKQDFTTAHNFKENPTQTHEYRENLTGLRIAIAQHRISEELHHTVQLLLPAVNDADSEIAESIISIDLRKQFISEFFGAMVEGIVAKSSISASAVTGSDDVSSESVDMLWGLTRELIGSTDRTVRLDVNSDQQVIESGNDQADHYIFMEDGSCVDAKGRLLPEGDPENLRLQAEFDVQRRLDEKRPAVRNELRHILIQNWSNLVKLLAKHPKSEDFKQLLMSAHLPDDVAKLMVDLLEQLLPSGLRESGFGQDVTRGMDSMSDQLMQEIISRIPDSLLDRFGGQVTRLINQLNPYEQMPFFKTFADQLVASLGENQSVQSVADILTKGYYTEICHADKRALANAILALGCPEFINGEISPKSMKAFVGVMTQAGGPGFQKAMQLFKSDIHIPEIREALASLDSEVNEEADEYIQNVIDQELHLIRDKTNNPKYMLVDAKTYSPNPDWSVSRHDVATQQLKLLGAATIAQTHKAFLWECENGQPLLNKEPIVAAMKIQRPRVAHRIYREMEALQRIANIPESAQQTLKELERSIVGETDFSREFQFGNIMAELYGSHKPTANVKVVDMLGQSNRLLIQRFSKGCSIEKVWSAKSAEFGLYFGEPSQHVERQLKKNTNRIQVLTQDNLVTGIQLMYQAKEHSHAIVHKLRLGESLQEQLQVAFFHSKVPGYVKTRELTDAIFNRFENPLKGKAFDEKPESLQNQAEFLSDAGERLQTLVGNFASAAFVGVTESNAYNLAFGNPSRIEPKDRERRVFIEPVLSQGQEQWQLFCCDAKGAIIKSITLDAAANLMHQLLSRQLQALVAKNGELTSAVDKLPLVEQRDLSNRLREILGESILFKDEAFIDSDRHDGNLLYNSESKKLMCIDTGAGTIITKYERYGMLKLATGLSASNVDLLMAGLEQLIPDLDKILQQDDKAFRAEHNNLSKRDILKQDLEKSIKGGFVDQEKSQEIFQFLLTQNLVDKSLLTLASDDKRNMTEIFFEDLLQDTANPGLKARALNFSNPHESVHAIIEYINSKRSTVALPPLSLDANIQDEFEAYLSGLDYGRVLRKDGPVAVNPFYLTTDPHNSLLFIKSIRKIANVLDTHNIYAPESIIQLNRGTKFIEDQIKNINAYKKEVTKKMELLDKSRKTNGVKQQFLTARVQAKLAPVNLGGAYLWGMLKPQDPFINPLLHWVPVPKIVADINKAVRGSIASALWSFGQSILRPTPAQSLL